MIGLKTIFGKVGCQNHGLFHWYVRRRRPSSLLTAVNQWFFETKASFTMGIPIASKHLSRIGEKVISNAPTDSLLRYTGKCHPWVTEREVHIDKCHRRQLHTLQLDDPSHSLNHCSLCCPVYLNFIPWKNYYYDSRPIHRLLHACAPKSIQQAKGFLSPYIDLHAHLRGGGEIMTFFATPRFDDKRDTM